MSAFLLGNKIKNLSDKLFEYGADKVSYRKRHKLDKYTTEAYAEAVDEASKHKKTRNRILIGATTIGRDLAPRVSARMDTGLTADCTSISH